MTTQELRDADRSHVWHPFTQQRGWAGEDAPIIERGDGCTLCDTDGRAYIDGTSSLWCNVHGHRHPAIDAAIQAQLGTVAHTTMLGLSHPGAIELAQRLLEIAPRAPGREPLSRVFYSDNGSTADEIALKMAFQWWQHRGETQRRAVRLPAHAATTATRWARSPSAASTSSTRSTAAAVRRAARRARATPTGSRRIARRARRQRRRRDHRAARPGRGRDAACTRRATCGRCASSATRTASC